MKVEVKETERIDDLHRNGYQIIQDPKRFCFGVDAVLLSGFAQAKKGEKVIDLGTVTGIIPILMEAKTDGEHFTGLEIQEDIAEMAGRSVNINSLSERVHIKCGDLKNCLSYYPPSSFNLITCNPPYMKSGSAILNDSDNKIISRHEVMCTLEDIIRVSSRLLKPGGHLAMVHRPNRLVDVLATMRDYSIEPKTIRFVHASSDKPPILFLTDAMYKANRDIKILPPLYLYDKDGNETPELKMIYERD